MTGSLNNASTLRLSAFQRVSPIETRESGEVAVGAEPLAIVFDRQRRMPGIGHQFPRCGNLLTKR